MYRTLDKDFFWFNMSNMLSTLSESQVIRDARSKQ
jgi:hypothetical protein